MKSKYQKIFGLVSPLSDDDAFIKKVVGKAEEPHMKKFSTRPIYALSAALIAITATAAGAYLFLGNDDLDLNPMAAGEEDVISQDLQDADLQDGQDANSDLLVLDDAQTPESTSVSQSAPADEANFNAYDFDLKEIENNFNADLKSVTLRGDEFNLEATFVFAPRADFDYSVSNYAVRFGNYKFYDTTDGSSVGFDAGYAGYFASPSFGGNEYMAFDDATGDLIFTYCVKAEFLGAPIPEGFTLEGRPCSFTIAKTLEAAGAYLSAENMLIGENADVMFDGSQVNDDVLYHCEFTANYNAGKTTTYDVGENATFNTVTCVLDSISVSDYMVSLNLTALDRSFLEAEREMSDAIAPFSEGDAKVMSSIISITANGVNYPVFIGKRGGDIMFDWTGSQHNAEKMTINIEIAGDLDASAIEAVVIGERIYELR